MTLFKGAKNWPVFAQRIRSSGIPATTAEYTDGDKDISMFVATDVVLYFEGHDPTDETTWIAYQIRSPEDILRGRNKLEDVCRFSKQRKKV